MGERGAQHFFHHCHRSTTVYPINKSIDRLSQSSEGRPFDQRTNLFASGDVHQLVVPFLVHLERLLRVAYRLVLAAKNEID